MSGLNQRDETVAAPYDPLRLCVHTTVALIACVLGPPAVLIFALVAIRGYVKARRAGLVKSQCKLGDTRTVITYLAVIAALAVAATPLWVKFWLNVWGV